MKRIKYFVGIIGVAFLLMITGCCHGTNTDSSVKKSSSKSNFGCCP